MTPPVLAVHDLGKVFGTQTAVRDLSFTVAPGEILGLVGPNGAGKTTTLRCIAGLARPTSGRITIAGSDISTHPLAAKARLSWLPDEPRLFDYLTVWEHLNLVARIYGVADWQQRGATLLDELELTDKRDVVPSELSRGMKQKLATACGFLHQPDLVLLDEPLTGLDPLGIRRMKASLVDRARNGTAMVLSSHLLGMVEEICQRVLVLHQGRCVALGSIDEIRAGAQGSLEDVFLRITGAA